MKCGCGADRQKTLSENFFGLGVVKVAEDDIAFKLAIFKKSLHLNDNTGFCSIIQASKLVFGSLLAKNNFLCRPSCGKVRVRYISRSRRITPVRGAPGWLAPNPVRGMCEPPSGSMQLQKLQFQSVICGNPEHSNWHQIFPTHIWLFLAQCGIPAGFIKTMQVEEMQNYKKYINIL